jgi:hypothetical protein
MLIRNLSEDGFVHRIQITNKSYGLTSSSSFNDLWNHIEWRAALPTSLHSTLSNICIIYFIIDEERWNIKYMSDTNGGEFDRVITSYDFDTESFEEESKCHYFHM